MKTKILSLLFLACYCQGFSQIKIAPTSTNLCEGSNVLLKALDVPANSVLQWQKNGEDISKASSNEYQANVMGNYMVKAIAQTPQWVNKKDPETQYETLIDVFFVNAKVGYAVGGLNKGEIIKTVDGGKTWINQNVGSNTFLTSVYFIDEFNGWAVGRYNAILNTTDGGKNWINITLNNTEWDTYYNDVQFTDAKNGWIVDVKGRILRTTDGGMTWIPKPHDKSVTKIYFKNVDNGWAIDSWNIYRSVDGGESWNVNYTLGYTQPILEGVSGLMSIYFLNDKIGWVAGYGTIITTSDGGKTWRKIDGIERNDYFHTIHFTDEKTGFALTDGRVYYQTNDGGVTWIRKDTGIYGSMATISFIGNEAWATDYRGSIIKMSGNGNKWETQRGNPEVFTDMSFVNSNIGFRTGNKGLIEKTKDGGLTWKKQNSNTFTDITKIKFVDVNTGWVLDYGNLGGILKTMDGGETWEKNLSVAYVQDMAFTDIKNGWIKGHGSILKTIDGGVNWTQNNISAIGSVSPFNSICFSDSKNGWIVGHEGLILKTNDGGDNWIKVKTLSIPNKQNSYVMTYFKNANEGWVVGTDVALRTTDGGLTWTEQNFEVQKTYNYLNISSINFADDRNGWVLTGWGKSLRTVDGGATWNIEDSKYNKMFFLNSQTGWAMDLNKSFLKYEAPLLSTSNTITINPKPAVPTLAWNNSDGKLTATTATTSPQLTWLKGVDELKNITTTTYQPTSSGLYSVRVTDGNGCSEISKAVEITILASENPLNDLGVNVYPNPSSNGIFKVAYTRFSNEMEATMQVIGLDGLPLNNQKMVRQNNTFEGEINASNLATGIYLLQIISGEQKAVVKISIAK